MARQPCATVRRRAPFACPCALRCDGAPVFPETVCGGGGRNEKRFHDPHAGGRENRRRLAPGEKVRLPVLPPVAGEREYAIRRSMPKFVG
jgi:hypothetical protein